MAHGATAHGVSLVVLRHQTEGVEDLSDGLSLLRGHFVRGRVHEGPRCRTAGLAELLWLERLGPTQEFHSVLLVAHRSSNATGRGAATFRQPPPGPACLLTS